jgi:hypothetical protein
MANEHALRPLAFDKLMITAQATKNKWTPAQVISLIEDYLHEINPAGIVKRGEPTTEQAWEARFRRVFGGGR